ncbi:septation protein A [Rhodobacteraceae bacterium W635]|uniref:inner membrane-spanning protein YciB n=1 Tax=Nioella halotolerans TaxID=2303578 RepID=UPI000E3DA495|nr:septation protein A [Rhodobacteraceae bacterium W635]
MEQRTINPYLKSALELGPPILFFIVYLWIKDETFTIAGHDYSGFIVATAGFIPLLLASIAALWWLTGKLSRMQIFTAVLVVVFGGLTVWFDDERFFKMKTTLVYAFFVIVLGIGLLRRESWLEFVMGEMMPMAREGWMILTRRLVAAFALMALANEIVWRTQTTEFWVTFETFVLPGFLFVVFMFQAKLFERYMVEKDEG